MREELKSKLGYKNVMEYLMGLIEEKQDGDILPSQTQLTHQLGVSHITVRRALIELEKAGMLYRIQGKGTFVRKNKILSAEDISLFVLMPGYWERSSFLKEMIEGIYGEMERENIHITLYPFIKPQEKIYTVFRKGLFHGVVGALPEDRNIDILREFVYLGIPVMVINRVLSEHIFNYVSVDHFEGGRKASFILAGRGHKKFCCIGSEGQTWIKQRLEGFKKGIEEKGMSLSEKDVIMVKEKGRPEEKVKDMVRKFSYVLKRNSPTCVFISGGWYIEPVLSVIKEKGMKIPDDIEVITFDRVPYYIKEKEYIHEIIQPFFQIGERAIKEIAKIIKGEKRTVHIKIMPEFNIKNRST